MKSLAESILDNDFEDSLDNNIEDYKKWVKLKDIFMKCIPEDVKNCYVRKFPDPRIEGCTVYISHSYYGAKFWGFKSISKIISKLRPEIKKLKYKLFSSQSNGFKYYAVVPDSISSIDSKSAQERPDIPLYIEVCRGQISYIRILTKGPLQDLELKVSN